MLIFYDKVNTVGPQKAIKGLGQRNQQGFYTETLMVN